MSEDRLVPPLRPRVITGWFALNGFVVASWVAHIPRVSAALGVPPGTLGLALLCMAPDRYTGWPSLLGPSGEPGPDEWRGWPRSHSPSFYHSLSPLDRCSRWRLVYFSSGQVTDCWMWP
jgi:hypothetical protein